MHEHKAQAAGIQIIKRFSGGGTVVVDENTLFATLIMQSQALPEVECYPRPIMQWSQEFYQPIFGQYSDFHLREHGKKSIRHCPAESTKPVIHHF